MEDLPVPILLHGFVLSLRPSEVLLTFPELPGPPQGLESEAQATLRYDSQAGQVTALGRILRVASGPPVTVTFKRLVPMVSDPRRSLVRTSANLPVSVRVLSSSVNASVSQEEIPSMTQNLSSSGMLISTSLLLAVGDLLRLRVQNGGNQVDVRGRVSRVFENENPTAARFGVGIELVPDSDGERESWMDFLGEFQRSIAR